jgi:hypothetical protein
MAKINKIYKLEQYISEINLNYTQIYNNKKKKMKVTPTNIFYTKESK